MARAQVQFSGEAQSPATMRVAVPSAASKTACESPNSSLVSSSFDDGKFISHEVVSGNNDGVTEVKSVGEILPDGRLRSSAQYLKNGEWVDGHSFVYVEDPAAEVIFK